MFIVCQMYNPSSRTCQGFFEQEDSVSFHKYGTHVLPINMAPHSEGTCMKTGRPKPALLLTGGDDGSELQSWVTALDSLASGRMRRIGLLSHVGLSNATMAEKIGKQKLRWGYE